MNYTYPVIEGAKPHVYKYGLRLTRNNYTDLSSFEAVKRRKRHFAIYRWQQGLSHRFGRGGEILVSGWVLWLEFRNRKWEKKDEQMDTFAWMGSPLAPMHMFFETGEEFKAWLGRKEVEAMFAELI